jgi:epoxyqueuosine reductase
MQRGDEFASGLIEATRAEGFPLAGVVDLSLSREAYAEHVAHYDRWLAEGRAGAMEYLVRGRARRADPRAVFPEAKSVLCVALPYPKRAAGEAPGPRYARYLQMPDYHDEVAVRLERALKRAGPELKWKICVDTSAVLERAWAAIAGLGWIGKNTMLIHPKLGSYLFLGVALLDRETGRAPAPLADYCGHCTRCLDACPTKAFVAPRALDSQRCISYWTLEKRGELSLTPDDRGAIGTWVAGCDLCQEACPFNLKAAREDTAEPFRGATGARDWITLLEESEDDYRARVRDSALRRAKPGQFSRNLAIAVGNAVAVDPELARELAARITERARRETDSVARAEWERTSRFL